jgi:hypothetical protein
MFTLMRAIENRDIADADIELKKCPSLALMGLKHAAKYGRLGCIQHIYEKYANKFPGADVGTKDLNQLLLISTRHDWVDIFLYLCQQGANPLAKGEYDEECLLMACKYDCPDIFMYICKYYDVQIDDFVQQGFKSAYAYGYLNTIHLLLIFGSSLNQLIGCYVQNTTFSPILAIFKIYNPKLSINVPISDIDCEKKRRHRLEVKLLMPRIFEICSCFKDLSANEQLAIVNYSIKWALNISQYTKWTIITMIKHFNDNSTFET